MEMGKNRKRRGNPTGFWRGTTTMDGGVPNLPSLLFSSSPSLFLIWSCQQGGRHMEGRGLGFGGGVGHCSGTVAQHCSQPRIAGPPA